MIVRIWRGWTVRANAAAYESLLRDEIFPGIGARGIKGYRGVRLLRRDEGGETEFMTVMRFESLKDVRDFAGQNYEAAVIPPRARALLARCDEKALHYQESFESAMTGSAATDSVRLLTRAMRFAAERHVHQRRKGDGAEPYINHLAEVADLVAEATGGRDVDLVAAALLHDVVEDTATSPAEVAAEFGEDVAALVAEVTDDKTLPKAERKRLQVEHAPSISQRAKVLKLADKTSNLRALAASPPLEWPAERRRDYVQWARAVVAGLRGASPWLEERLDEAAAAAEASLAAGQGNCGRSKSSSA